jgi:hypothetical protein
MLLSNLEDLGVVLGQTVLTWFKLLGLWFFLRRLFVVCGYFGALAEI